ncbi:uncharacterized protein FIBRA_05953 [Fibroporia radiculosa]|uniref:Helicase C-terminal domain-containing protein n=1 Tax=Fibroporia radiculosa TaxID=599839 RepID=J4GRX4_9APHY|nr:uncharacterized protein FIBRA_05953 [Fibroporia radiculosa]CCM03805.1 predicted protein [Fibroporia radiculosa]
MARKCTICCEACRSNKKTPRRATRTNPYEALGNFLPAGTLSLQLITTDLPCQHCHSEDGWHKFPGYAALSPLVSAEEEPIIQQLDFLIANHFIAATCFSTSSSSGPLAPLLLRIYLIPWDLAGVQGALRVRAEGTITGPARHYMRLLLPQIRQDDREWEGGFVVSDDSKKRFFCDIDNRRMTEIYGDLPSPKPSATYDVLRNIQGMKSNLYRYQRRSVSTMLSRELSPGAMPDPLHIKLTGIDGLVFFLQPASMEILQECPMVSQARGGILCEELGTGKTVMMLALILATLDQISSPEEAVYDPRPVLTPLSYRHFPTAEPATSRRRMAQGGNTKRSDHESPTRIPSLVEFLLHYCRTRPDGLHLRDYQDRLEQQRLWKPLMHNNPFYHHYNSLNPEVIRSNRRQINPGPKVMYLSSATLVVVPMNLFNQWKNEIMKHCHDTLRVLEARTGVALPSAQQLATKYDLILMTYEREPPRISTDIAFVAAYLGLSRESTKNKVDKLHTWTTCTCHSSKGIRIPNCSCKARERVDGVSPLLQIRWKRLVIDEGHISASLSTNLTPFTKQLSIERKWIVTGTPTTNLLGLHFGQGSELQYPEDLHEEKESSPESSLATNSVGRQWTSDDRDDLGKLSKMITHFLGMPQFAGDQRAFDTWVSHPLLESPCPRPGAIQVLTQVMSSVMIRHRIEDLEDEVLLPLLQHDTVLLDLDPFALKSYNIMQAMIVVNAVDSERKDQDYFFHPTQQAALRQLVDNMSQSVIAVMFWRVDEEMRIAADILIKECDDHIQRAHKRGISQQDLSLLEEAVQHARSVADDYVWRGMQKHIYVFHRTHAISTEIYQAWTPLSPSTFQSFDSVLTPDRIGKLREYVIRHPMAPIQNIIRRGQDIREEEREKRYQEIVLSKKKKDPNDTRRKEREAVKQAEALGKQTELQQQLLDLPRKPQTVYSYEIKKDLDSGNIKLVQRKVLGQHTPSPLEGWRLGNSTSTKLDYILKEVLQHSPSEKFLIFSKSALSLAYVAEGLQLIRVKYLQFTSQVNAKERQQRVITFETSDLYRVFLMELKHGARGLNLVSASRVIFCEPVWQADVETQAIKRVHRIGQTRPVIVKTLAIRSTSEEMMVSRREALKGNGGKQPNFTDDWRIRDFIANPKFLSESSHPRLNIDFPLFPGSHHDEDEESESSDSMAIAQNESLSTQLPSDPTPTEPPQKKRRVVRFADDA